MKNKNVNESDDTAAVHGCWRRAPDSHEPRAMVGTAAPRSTAGRHGGGGATPHPGPHTKDGDAAALSSRQPPPRSWEHASHLTASPSPPNLMALENFGSWGPTAPSQPTGERWTRSCHIDGVCALAKGPGQRGRGRGCGYPKHPQKQSGQAGHSW